MLLSIYSNSEVRVCDSSSTTFNEPHSIAQASSNFCAWIKNDLSSIKAIHHPILMLIQAKN